MLTEEEKEVIKLLGEVWNKFLALPDPHPSDDEEFCHYIHILQRHVMVRPTRRNHPEMFKTKEYKSQIQEV